MGNCISTKRSRNRSKKRNKHDKDEEKKRGKADSGRKEVNKETKISKEDKTDEVKFPVEKNKIFSPDRFEDHPRHKLHKERKSHKPGKLESHDNNEKNDKHERHKKHEKREDHEEDEKSDKVRSKPKAKRAPIKNPKLYNEDIPIKPAKGANMKSWWEEDPRPPVATEEKRNVVQEFGDDAFPGDAFPDSDPFSSSKFQGNKSPKRNNRNVMEDHMNEYEDDGFQPCATNGSTAYASTRRRDNFRKPFDEVTLKSASSKAPSIIASMYDFDYQPDISQSKIVARGRPSPRFNEDEDEGFPGNFNRAAPFRNNKSQINSVNKFRQTTQNTRNGFGDQFYPELNEEDEEDDCLNQNIVDEDCENGFDDQFQCRQNYRPRPANRNLAARRDNPQALTLANIQKELKKISTINESSWKEVIKCQTEISKYAKRNANIFLKCDSKLLLEAARSIIQNSTSGRSNICKNSLLCIGDLFYTFPEQLSVLASEAISTIIRKTVQGTSTFIQIEANKALAKIVLKGSEAKLITHLINLYKYQQAARVSILNCITIIVDRLGEDVAHLKQLSSVAELAFQGLSDASQPIRKSANVLASLLEDYCDIKQLLTKLHLKAEIRTLVERSMAKYDVNTRDEFLEAITSIN